MKSGGTTNIPNRKTAAKNPMAQLIMRTTGPQEVAGWSAARSGVSCRPPHRSSSAESSHCMTGGWNSPASSTMVNARVGRPTTSGSIWTSGG